MRDFFRGWRRKVGCATLLMACLFMVGWIRTVVDFDQFCFSSGRNSLEYLQNGNPNGQGVIYWNHFRGEAGASLSQTAFRGWNRFPKVGRHEYKPILIYPFLGGSASNSYCGFSFCSVTSPHATGFMICIPYWSIVTPLTLLSAYLILWKPRKRDSSPPQS